MSSFLLCFMLFWLVNNVFFLQRTYAFITQLPGNINQRQVVGIDYLNNRDKGRMKLKGGGIIRGDRIPMLIELIYSGDDANEDNIVTAIDEIADQNRAFIANAMDRNYLNKLNGSWKLIWSNERSRAYFYLNILKRLISEIYNKNKSTFAILRDSGFSGQIIDQSKRKIIATSQGTTIEGILSEDKNKPGRLTFRIGQRSGWFDTLYVNDIYRLSKDNNGNYMVYRRA